MTDLASAVRAFHDSAPVDAHGKPASWRIAERYYEFVITEVPKYCTTVAQVERAWSLLVRDSKDHVILLSDRRYSNGYEDRRLCTHALAFDNDGMILRFGSCLKPGERGSKGLFSQYDMRGDEQNDRELEDVAGVDPDLDVVMVSQRLIDAVPGARFTADWVAYWRNPDCGYSHYSEFGLAEYILELTQKHADECTVRESCFLWPSGLEDQVKGFCCDLRLAVPGFHLGTSVWINNDNDISVAEFDIQGRDLKSKLAVKSLLSSLFDICALKPQHFFNYYQYVQAREGILRAVSVHIPTVPNDCPDDEPNHPSAHERMAALGRVLEVVGQAGRRLGKGDIAPTDLFSLAASLDPDWDKEINERTRQAQDQRAEKGLVCGEGSMMYLINR
jgi:hypothetical protein